MIHQFAESVVRPRSLKWDREHGVPDDFLRHIVADGRRPWARSVGRWGRGAGRRRRSRDGPAKRKKRQVAAHDHPRRRGARLGRRGAASLLAGPRARRPAGARERDAGAEEALLLDLQRHERPTLRWGAYALTEPGAGQRRRGHPHELPQGRQALGHQRPQVLHHQRRARVVERGLRDRRSGARARGAPRVRRREGDARVLGRQDRRQDGPPRERDRGARVRRLPRARGEPPRAARRATPRRRAS